MIRINLLLLAALLVAPGLVWAQPDDACGDAPAPRLRAGMVAQVTEGPSNYLRVGPGLDANRVGYLPGGAVFEVTGGPECADGYVWYEVSYEGQVGWTAEGVPDEYWLVPLTAVERTEAGLEPDEAVAAPAVAGWQVYSNAEFGFSFSYPPDWTVLEASRGVLLTRGSEVLAIGVRGPDEAADFTFDIGPGTLETVDGLSFVDQTIQMEVLRDRAAVKGVFFATFDGERAIPAGGLTFGLRFDDFDPDYDAVNIMPETLDLVKQVLETVTVSGVPARPAAPAEPDAAATAEPDAAATPDPGEVIDPAAADGADVSG